MTELSEHAIDPDDRVLELTIGGLLCDVAAAHPDAPALVEPAAEGGRRWTYRELEAQARARAHRLLECFTPGERVALWAPTSADWLVTEYAVALAGLVLVTVNPALRDEELAHVLGVSTPAGLILVDEHRGHRLRAVYERIADRAPSVRHVLDLLGDDWRATGTPRPLPTSRPDDVAHIHFTSGTTGAPKGAMLHHRGPTNNMRFHARLLGMGPGDLLVSPVPMFHVGGAVMANLTALNAGAALAPVRSWDAGRVLELIESERATAILGVPTMFTDLLAHPDLPHRDVSSIRLVLIGGSAVAPELIRHLAATFGASVRNSFGQTECGSIISATRADDAPEDVARTLGRPFPGIAVKLVGPDGATVARDRAGELLVRGYQVTSGYFGDVAQTAAALDADGWLRTGDVCRMDKRGHLHFVGRTREIIVRGGENIFPAEIEDALAAHPDVGAVAVVGVPDARLGEAVAAFVCPASGADPSVERLQAFATARLAREKVPAHWRIVAELPRTAAGKVRKPDLVAAFTAHRP